MLNTTIPNAGYIAGLILIVPACLFIAGFVQLVFIDNGKEIARKLWLASGLLAMATALALMNLHEWRSWAVLVAGALCVAASAVFCRDSLPLPPARGEIGHL
ncbi:MAG: hypothetical protein JWM46_105 [Candidatus Kaiserbacteria bacterium]|nr:hypothetical protein [Candidatus Kaiserbacteria bacterium]